MGEVKVYSHNLGPTSSGLTSIWFHVNPPSYSYDSFFKIWPSKSKGHSSRSYSRCNILSIHIPFVPCWSALPFLRYSNFKNWPWKFKVKVMGEVKVQSHNVSLTSYQLTSLWFHVNRSSHSWEMAFQNLTLKIQGQGHSSTDIFVFHFVAGNLFLRQPIPYLTLKTQGQDHGLHGKNLWSHLMPSMQSIYLFFICGNQTISLMIWQILIMKIMGQCHGQSNKCDVKCRNTLCCLDQYMTPNSQNTRGECPQQMEVNASPSPQMQVKAPTP